MSRLVIAPLSILLLAVGVYAAILNFTFTVTNASVTTSGTNVSVSGPATLEVIGVGTDTGTFRASGSLTNISGGNVTIPFTTTLGYGTLTGTVTFPETALVNPGPASSSTTITSGTGMYAGSTSSTIPASGLTGPLLSGGTLSFSTSGTADGRSFTFTVKNAPVTVSGTTVFSGPATLTLFDSSPDAGTFTASGSLTNISGGNVTVPFTVTLGHGTINGSVTFPETVLVNSGPFSASATIAGGSGSYAGYYTSSTVTASGTVTGSPLSGGTISFTTSGTVNTPGGGTTTPAPTIASVTDGASYTSNVAQGGFFIVWGTNLYSAKAGLTDFPWPTILNGVKVTFTPAAGGAGINAYLNYVSAGQFNCLLPSTVPVGSYNVTVTNGTVSNQVLTQVAAIKPALFTQDQSGTGLAVVQNYISASVPYDLNRLTTGVYNQTSSSPAKPGQVVVAWGTGLGPYVAGDDANNVQHDFSTTEPIAAVVGGISIPVAFAGIPMGLAAVDQINFTLPANVPTGCAVPLQISVAGVLSAATTIAIAPSASATACVQPGYTTQQLQNLDNGGTINSGGFALSQTVATVPSIGTEKLDSIGGSFSQVTGFQLSSSGTQNVTVTTIGSCTVVHAMITSTTAAASHVTNFDAGTVTLTGPSGTNLNNQKLTETSNTYSYTIGTEGITIPGQPNGLILAGTYTLAGAGGNDVGPFNTSITLGPPLSLNNPLPATVTESAGLTINWTGGNASDPVNIIGYSGSVSGTGANAITNATEFICTTTAGQKTFTVPAAVLTLLPTVTAAQVNAGTASGALDVTSGVTPVNFTAPLKKDGSNIPSVFSYTFVTGGSVLYQ